MDVYIIQEMTTVLAQLITSTEDSLGYITYVFKCLDDDVSALTRYIMCTRPPNWEARQISDGEIGFLEFKEVRAGMDRWYNGETMIPYNYDAIWFNRFIEKPKEENNKYIC